MGRKESKTKGRRNEYGTFLVPDGNGWTRIGKRKAEILKCWNAEFPTTRAPLTVRVEEGQAAPSLEQ
jgi:hypothetical protein